MSQKQRKTKVIQMEAKAVREQIQQAQEKLKEIEVNEATARIEEQQMLQQVEEKIQQLCADSNLFCGVILSTQDILNIVDFAIKTKEPVEIPFRLYFRE